MRTFLVFLKAYSCQLGISEQLNYMHMPNFLLAAFVNFRKRYFGGIQGKRREGERNLPHKSPAPSRNRERKWIWTQTRSHTSPLHCAPLRGAWLGFSTTPLWWVEDRPRPSSSPGWLSSGFPQISRATAPGYPTDCPGLCGSLIPGTLKSVESSPWLKKLANEIVLKSTIFLDIPQFPLYSKLLPFPSGWSGHNFMLLSING